MTEKDHLDELLNNARERDIKETRWDRGSESKFMIEHAGYVMARKKGAAPFLMTKKEWLALPSTTFGAECDAAYFAERTPPKP